MLVHDHMAPTNITICIVFSLLTGGKHFYKRFLLWFYCAAEEWRKRGQ